jgi:hypothetical protein
MQFLASMSHVSQSLQDSATFFDNVPRGWPHQHDLLTWCQQMTPGVSALLIIVGLIYLLFGFQIFRGLVLVNAAVVGAYIGAAWGKEGDAETIGAVICAVAAAAIAWPTMKYAVALMGGIFGALLGASVWHALGLDPTVDWAGALVGLIGFGMLSFVLFRGSVMMYTSLQGAFMLVFGILGLIYQYQDFAKQVSEHMKLQPFLLPAAIFIPALLGLIFQQHNTATAGGGGGGGGGGHGGGGGGGGHKK